MATRTPIDVTTTVEVAATGRQTFDVRAPTIIFISAWPLAPLLYLLVYLAVSHGN